MSSRRMLPFGVVSGIGLALDYAIYTALCGWGTPAGWANLASAATAVTFVFAVSARRIFRAPHSFLLGAFLLYAGYQAVAVSAASWAVGALTAALDGRYLLGKTLVVPFSFLGNYGFMSWLFKSRALDVAKHP